MVPFCWGILDQSEPFLEVYEHKSRDNPIFFEVCPPNWSSNPQGDCTWRQGLYGSN